MFRRERSNTKRRRRWTGISDPRLHLVPTKDGMSIWLYDGKKNQDVQKIGEIDIYWRKMDSDHHEVDEIRAIIRSIADDHQTGTILAVQYRDIR